MPIPNLCKERITLTYFKPFIHNFRDCSRLADIASGSPLLILTPNIASMRRAVGDFWRDPTHVRLYPVSALSRLLRRAGWKIEKPSEHTDRAPSTACSIIFGIRKALLGSYRVGNDLLVIARRKA